MPRTPCIDRFNACHLRLLCGTSELEQNKTLGGDASRYATHFCSYRLVEDDLGRGSSPVAIMHEMSNEIFMSYSGKL